MAQQSITVSITLSPEVIGEEATLEELRAFFKDPVGGADLQDTTFLIATSNGADSAYVVSAVDVTEVVETP